MFSRNIKLILFALFPFFLSAQDVAQWTIFEDVRHPARDYENPLQDLSAEVVFTAPLGRTTVVRPAFWDYNRDWRVRFSPNEPGRLALPVANLRHPRAEEPMTHPGTGVGPAWHDAVDLEGSHNLRVLAELFADLDWTSLRPAQALLARQPGESDVKRWVAIAQGSGFALAYTADGEPIELRQKVRAARWHSPRTGEVVDAKAGDATFTPPSKKDWVLWLGLP